MKWILTLIYISSALLVSGCASLLEQDKSKSGKQVMAAPFEVIIEHPLTAQVRELSWQLLQQPYFVQGSFEHGQSLYIRYPNTVATLPITHHELQRASAETFAQPDWFDIQILTEQESRQRSGLTDRGYSLVINILPIETDTDKHTLTIELINNRFNTVEAQVNSIVLL